MSSKVVVLDLLNLFGFVSLRENTLHRLETEPESTLRLKKNPDPIFAIRTKKPRLKEPTKIE